MVFDWIKARLGIKKLEAYRFPPHIEAVKLDAGLLGLHIDQASRHTLNPACESGTRKITRPKTEH